MTTITKPAAERTVVVRLTEEQLELTRTALRYYMSMFTREGRMQEKVRQTLEQLQKGPDQPGVETWEWEGGRAGLEAAVYAWESV